MKNVTNKRHATLICLCVIMVLVSTVLLSACSPNKGTYYLDGNKNSTHKIEILAGQKCKFYNIFDADGDIIEIYNGKLCEYEKAGNKIRLIIPSSDNDGRYINVQYQSNKLTVYGRTYNKK